MNSSVKCKHFFCESFGPVRWDGQRCPGCNGSGLQYPPNCMCPVCGSMIISYGGGWRCAALYCSNSTGNPAPNCGPEPEWWRDGTHVTKDGDMWCAVSDKDANIQEQPAGFGRSPQEAVDELVKAK